MIIGIDASRANRPHKSGTEWYSYYLIKYFAQLDDKNQYILYTDKPLSGGLVDLTTQELPPAGARVEPQFDEQGFQIIKSPHNNFRGLVLYWPLASFWTLGRLSLQMLIKKPDILFVPAHGLPLWRPKKTINTIHDVAFKSEAGIYERFKLGPQSGLWRKIVCGLVRIFTGGRHGATSIDYLDWSTAYSLRHSSKILTVSECAKQDILKHYRCSPDKIKVVHNGFNDRLYKKIEQSEETESIIAKYGIKPPYILYVGRLERKKNTPLLLKSFIDAKYQNKDLAEKLVLIGDASFGYDEIKYIAHEFHLEDEVIMPGWADEKDMPYIFAGASAFIMPSLHEGFGITILQSMACGVPTAVSDLPVLREVAGGAVLFFDPRDRESLSSAIDRICTDKSLRQDLAAKGLARAKEFSWEKCARETLKEIIET